MWLAPVDDTAIELTFKLGALDLVPWMIQCLVVAAEVLYNDRYMAF